MTEATQFCVALENKPGTLAALCGVLRKASVDVQAIFVSNDDEFCWVNLVISSTEAAERLLCEGGYHFFTEKVLTIRTENRPRALETVAAQLSENGVNINYVYGSSMDASEFTLVLSVSDHDAVAKSLGAARQTA